MVPTKWLGLNWKPRILKIQKPECQPSGHRVYETLSINLPEKAWLRLQAGVKPGYECADSLMTLCTGLSTPRQTGLRERDLLQNKRQ